MSKDNYYEQNTYTVVNKEKYKGKGKPFYRSSYEKRLFFWCDHNKNVLEWSSESVVIPYVFDIDKKPHRYFPDVKAKIKTHKGIITYIIEVKPFKQTLLPKEPKNRSKKRFERYKNEMFMYIRNVNKWDAAHKFCKKYGYEFKIITEKVLFNK